MSKINVGIDIGKAKFDAAILFPNHKVKTKKFENKLSGFPAFIDWLKKHEALDAHLCLEATGAYSEALSIYLFERNHQVSVVNPAKIKGFAQSELSRNKTDKADAQLIARFCRAMEPPFWQPKPQHIRELGDWLRRLQVLQDLHQQEANRLDVASACVRPSIQAIMKRLQKEIYQVKQRIKAHIDQHSDLRNKQQLLETIPGIGEATIAQVLAFMGNVEDFDNAKKMAAFVGLNPKQRQSGSSVKGRTRLSKTGDSNLRKAFYMPALCAKRYNPIIKTFYDRLEATGKPPMLIIGAVMRKLVHIIYGVLKSGKAFDAQWAASCAS